jgi:hypothetical protein
VFERETLYEKVWKIPITQLAREYGISDVGLAKICQKLNVPRPPMGYWAKLKYGKVIKIPPLPSIGPNDPTKHVYYHNSQSESEHKIARISQGMTFPDLKIVVPESLDALHKFVRGIKNDLKVPFRDVYGMLTCFSRGIHVRVSPESKDRALCVLDALIKGFESAGYGFKKNKSNDYEIFFLEVDGEKIEFSLTESTHRKDHVLTAEEKQQKKRDGILWNEKRYDFFPTGELSLNITTRIISPIRKSWSDSKGMRLEEHLLAFINGTILSAQVIKIERKQEEENQRKREEERRRWEENERKRREEESKIEELAEEAKQWRSSELVRQYIRAIETQLSTSELDDKHVSELKKWIAWAKEKVEEIDPISQIFPEKQRKKNEDKDK